MMAFLQKFRERLIEALPHRNRVRDPRLRPEYYDGTEKADYTPPNRYARGKRALPAPPPGGLGM